MSRSPNWRETQVASRLRIGGAVIGLVGCVSVALADLLGILFVERHDPISETISTLAIGRYAWIQDLGIDLFAAGVIAVAVALYAWRAGGATWKIGCGLLLVLAVDLVLIAEHNQYAARPSREGASIHIYLVIALYVLFALVAFLLARDLDRRSWRRFNLIAGAAWTVLAPLLFVVPTAWDGAYERALSLILLGWFAGVCWTLLRRAPSSGRAA